MGSPCQEPGTLEGQLSWGEKTGSPLCSQVGFSEVEGGGQQAERNVGLGLGEMLGLRFHTSAFNIRSGNIKFQSTNAKIYFNIIL